MKKSELRQMIREEYRRSLTEAPSKRAQAIQKNRKEMVKNLNAFEKSAQKLDSQLNLDDKQLVRKFEMIEKRMQDMFQYLDDLEDLTQKLED